MSEKKYKVYANWADLEAKKCVGEFTKEGMVAATKKSQITYNSIIVSDGFLGGALLAHNYDFLAPHFVTAQSAVQSTGVVPDHTPQPPTNQQVNSVESLLEQLVAESKKQTSELWTIRFLLIVAWLTILFGGFKIVFH